jgi:hypothetical protein
VSSNLGDYITFDCHGSGSNRSCSVVGKPTTSEFMSSSPDSTSTASYAEVKHILFFFFFVFVSEVELSSLCRVL